MNLRTFYRLFYRHRIKKASFILRVYIFIVVPIKYLINLFYLEKKINLDSYKNNSPELFKKDLNYLFEHFNSDKGEFFNNQYLQPAKKNKEKIQAHGYAKFYEPIFINFKNKEVNILELGSFYGNSAAALYFYFNKASILTTDINPDMFKYKSNRVTNHYTDSSSRNSIMNNLIIKKKILKLSLRTQVICLKIK